MDQGGVMKVAIVTVDLQYEFLDPSSATVGRTQKAICLPGVRRLVRHARNEGWTIVHVATSHSSEDTLPLYLQRQGVDVYCVEGSTGAQIIDGIQAPGEAVVFKQSYSGFSDEGAMTAHLRSADGIVVCGIAVDCCVLTTAFDAATRHELEVFVPYDAVSASAVDDYLSGLRIIQKSAGSILGVDDLVATGPPAWRGLAQADGASTDKWEGWYLSQVERLQELDESAASLDLIGFAREIEALLE